MVDDVVVHGGDSEHPGEAGGGLGRGWEAGGLPDLGVEDGQAGRGRVYGTKQI